MDSRLSGEFSVGEVSHDNLTGSDSNGVVANRDQQAR